MKSTITLLFLSLFLTNISFSQHSIEVTINGLEENGELTVIAQKGASAYIEIEHKGTDGNSVVFNNISEGKWAIKLDATGYIYEKAIVLNVPNESSVIFDIEKFDQDDYSYEWNDDASDAGHAQQAFINSPLKIEFLNESINIPDNFSSLKMARKYGVILNDDILKWSEESAYKLLSNIERLPFSEKFWGDAVTEKFSFVVSLTDDLIENDIEIQKIGDINKVVVSKQAFTYAAPQIVLIEGLRGKYFSKRLYTAMLRMLTKDGTDSNALDAVADKKFGFAFMKPTDELTTLMNEDKSNFQEFDNDEKLLILTMLEELPEGMHKQDGLQYLVRRINGQPHPTHSTAPAIAWTGLQVIEFMESAFKEQTIEYMQRLILHEKCHFLWEYTFDQELKDQWADLGGWFEDPTSASGWSTNNTTGFVSPYGHLKNPNEDMSESVAYYVQNPEALTAASLPKFDFIRDRIMHGTRYVAIIPDELTFEVYNIHPDYYYPGKVIGSKVEVIGAHDEDKTLKLEFKLNSFNVAKDGASRGYVRFYSSVGTNLDIWLKPKNGTLDSILVAEKDISKHIKSGHWFLSQLQVYDQTNNIRLENASTIGMNLYINNSLEDEVPPVYQGQSTKMTPTRDKFLYVGSGIREDGNEYQALKLEMEYFDKLPLSRMLARINFSDDDPQSETPFSVDIQNTIEDNTYNSIKKGEVYFPIPEYYPTGNYEVVFSLADDIAGNTGRCYYVEDTTQFNENNFDIFEDERLSFMVETANPDVHAPVLKINEIDISAEPTNPDSPDGETLVKLQLIIRDTSDFVGLESGLKSIKYTLKDPQGGEHIYDAYQQLTEIAFNFFHLIESPIVAGEWRTFDLTALLPVGSFPGTWGLSSVQLIDRANNVRNYSFVELVRFDLVDTDYQFTTLPFANVNEDNTVATANQSNSKINVGCTPCDGINFHYSISSEFGGALLSGSGIINSDIGVDEGLDFSVYPDGKLDLRVEYSDELNQLIGIVNEKITKSTSVSISDVNSIIVNAYPNPTGGQIRIDFGASVSGEYELVNISGSIISKGKVDNENSLDMVLKAQPGIYMFNMTTQSGDQYVSKIVKL